MSIFEWLITCWKGWKHTIPELFSCFHFSTPITFGLLSILEQQLHNPLWCSICSPQLCVKRWIYSCAHLKGSYSSFPSVKRQNNTKRLREKRKRRKGCESKSQFSASLLPSFIRSSSPTTWSRFSSGIRLTSPEQMWFIRARSSSSPPTSAPPQQHLCLSRTLFTTTANL